MWSTHKGEAVAGLLSVATAVGAVLMEMIVGNRAQDSSALGPSAPCPMKLFKLLLFFLTDKYSKFLWQHKQKCKTKCCRKEVYMDSSYSRRIVQIYGAGVLHGCPKSAKGQWHVARKKHLPCPISSRVRVQRQVSHHVVSKDSFFTISWNMHMSDTQEDTVINR